MGTTWVLHTETKGTGAQMVPLEAGRERPRPVEPVFVPRKRATRDEFEVPRPKPLHRFRIVDVMTRQILADDAGTRDAVDVLKDIRSIVDVTVYVWSEEEERWRMLTFAEQRAIWDLAQFHASDPQ